MSDVGLTEALAEHQRKLTEVGECICGEWPDRGTTDWPTHVAAAVERIVADRVGEAEQRGAVQALRDAAGEMASKGYRSAVTYLRARADRLAGDER